MSASGYGDNSVIFTSFITLGTDTRRLIPGKSHNQTRYPNLLY
jgi:hypothetical protein